MYKVEVENAGVSPVVARKWVVVEFGEHKIKKSLNLHIHRNVVVTHRRFKSKFKNRQWNLPTLEVGPCEIITVFHTVT